MPCHGPSYYWRKMDILSICLSIRKVLFHSCFYESLWGWIASVCWREESGRPQESQGQGLLHSGQNKWCPCSLVGLFFLAPGLGNHLFAEGLISKLNNYFDYSLSPCLTPAALFYFLPGRGKVRWKLGGSADSSESCPQYVFIVFQEEANSKGILILKGLLLFCSYGAENITCRPWSWRLQTQAERVELSHSRSQDPETVPDPPRGHGSGWTSCPLGLSHGVCLIKAGAREQTLMWPLM